MPDRSNAEILLAAVADFNDPARRKEYLKLYAPSAVLHGYEGVEPGLEGITRFYDAFWTGLPDAHLTLDHVIAEGDDVACRFTVRATQLGELMGVPASGKRVEFGGITILRFQNGQCVERWSQADFAGLMRQIG